jgi:hypothetical protein
MLTPHRWARYRNDDGERWDTRHYDEDAPLFLDSESA